MLKRRWLLPIYLGVPIGLLIGGCVCWQTPQCLLYFHSHFYRLLLPLLVRQVDYYTLLFVGILAMLWLVVTVADRCPGAVRTVLRIVLPLSVLGLAAKLWLPDRVWPVMLRLLDSPALHFGALVTLGLGLLAALYWLRRTSRATTPRTTTLVAPADAQASSSGARASSRASSSGARASSRAHVSVDDAREDTNAPTGVTRITSLALQGVASLSLLLFLAINTMTGVYWALSTVAVRRQPNIILVMVCSLRADHLGCYGYDLNTTPNLDQFARESTRFAQAVSPSSWTLWSTASIMTSRYPERIFDKSDILAKYSLYPGLPAALSNLGYTTCSVSDHSFFIDNTVEFSYDFSQGFHHYDLAGGSFDQKAAPQVTSIALQRVRQLKDGRFFLYAMYGDVHLPYQRHNGYAFGPSRKDTLGPKWAASLPPSVRRSGMGRLGLLENLAADHKVVWEDREHALASYNSGIAFTDHAIGDLLTGLKTLGLYDDSLIIFCADHGEEFLEHGSYGHMHTLYHEVTDVPLLIKFPRQRQGTVVGGRFPLIDLFPSVMTMMHGDYAHLGVQGDGVDLPALLRCADKPIFGATIHDTRSVLSGQAKYYKMSATALANPGEFGVFTPLSRTREQLFDLRKDPGEYQSLLPAQPEVAATLLDVLHRHDAYLKSTATPAGPAKSFSVAEEEQLHQRLRALGYSQE